MIIYIHGFGSSGQGGKATIFRDYFKKQAVPFIAPSLSYIPDLAIKTLEELIESYDDVTLIGSSMGGYYSIYLAEKYKLKAVLINPAVASAKTLQRVMDKTGFAKNYYDESLFTWQDSYVEMLKNYQIEKPKENYLLMLQKADDVLDYKEALVLLPKSEQIVEEGGSHSFDCIERHLDKITQYCHGL